MSNVRTRLAPSPTGEDIHIGNLYTALINYAVAKKANGQFIIRIEDTDRERFVKGAEEKILSSLKAYGISYDEGPDIGGPFAPYRQSERLAKYKTHAKDLIKKGNAYYCFCTKERLETLRKEQIAKKRIPRYDKYCLNHVKDAEKRIERGEPYVVRLNVIPGKKVWFDDVIRGRIVFDSSDIDDQILIKSDGYPTYHMSVVVDDHVMEISHVIRAEEWISSTPKHVLLYESFGWKLPIFAHVPILRNPDKSKLSKRKNPVWASWYLKEGFLPEAVLNYLALMGWSHPEQKEIFSLSEFIKLFDLSDMNPVGPVFDIKKLTWMNQQYIQTSEINDLKKRLLDFYRDSEVVSRLIEKNIFIDKILELAKTRMETLKDFLPLIQYMITPPEITSFNDEHRRVIPVVKEALENVVDWKHDKLFQALKSVMTEYRSVRMPVFYVLFTGNKQGLPLPEMLEILGKEETLKRLEKIT